MDALVYASIKNNLTSDSELSDLHKTNVFMRPPVIWVNDKQGDLKVLDDVLNQTTIKKSVCLGNPTVSVRIPIPNDVSPYPQNLKFGYIDKNVVVPDDLRKQMESAGYTPNSDKCNKFMHLYCKNALKEYLATTGGVFNRSEWPNFKPECACYAPQPNWMANYGSLPARCWAPECVTGAGAYLDLASQGETNCNLQICNQTINLEKIEAQKIESTIQATCALNEAKGLDNPLPSTPIPPPPPSKPFQPPKEPTIVPKPSIPSEEAPQPPTGPNVLLIVILILVILLILGAVGYFIWKRRTP